jgi:hypothetical protein
VIVFWWAFFGLYFLASVPLYGVVIRRDLFLSRVASDEPMNKKKAIRGFEEGQRGDLFLGYRTATKSATWTS